MSNLLLIEYETDEDILHIDDAAESSEELSEQDDEISFDEPAQVASPPARVAFPPAPVEIEELRNPTPPPVATSSDGTSWYTDPPSANGKFSAFLL